MEEFNIYRPGMPPEIHQKMENSIRIMEIELVKSDRYIANLRKQLNEAKSQVAIAASSAPSASNEVPSPRDYVDRHKAMAEIHQLRENNHVQRGLIVKLENEINALRQSLTTVEDEETRKAKEIEVARLERLVKDCQNCIETLEGQVDNLYAQLRERESDQPPTAEMQEEGDDLNASEASGLAEMASSTEALEAMAGEMENIIFQYRQSHALNRFAQELSQHQELDSIATAVMQFLAEFQAEAGLCLRSHLEVKKYFPEGRFNEQQRQLTCSFAVKDPVFYINETTLFSSERINLMLLPTIDARPPHESVVQGLVKIVDAYIGLLEAGKLGSVTEQKMDAWVEATKNQLADLDIQYAYQLEENKKAFNQF
jgi:macrodomain Ter protein organizer (MatP/YcbG family)